MLAERVERRRLAASRSVLMALIEAAGDPKPWSLSALAERAGVGAPIVRETLEALKTLGLVEVGDDGALRLVSISGTEGVPDLPPVVKSRPTDCFDPEMVQRAEKFFVVHAERVAPVRGSKPSRTDQAIAAACRILRVEPSGVEILRRLDWALEHRFFADKVLLMTGFESWFGRISAAYRADRVQSDRQLARDAQRDAVRAPAVGLAETRAPSVSYESDRVEFARS